MSGRGYLKGTTCVSAYHAAHADCEVTPCLLQLLLIQAPTCTVSYMSPVSQFSVLFKFDVTVNGKKMILLTSQRWIQKIRQYLHSSWALLSGEDYQKYIFHF